MSIQDLGAVLKRINPNAGLNPHGNCMHCAVITANTLVTGNPPTRATGAIAVVAGQGGVLVQSFPTDYANHVLGIYSRARAVYNWLLAAPAGVYAVDAEDHAYNFLKHAGAIYLIDSNQHVFRQILQLRDFEGVGHNSGVDERYNYNYADPEPDDDDGSDINIYYFGALHGNWAGVLTQNNRMIGYTGSGAVTWG